MNYSVWSKLISLTVANHPIAYNTLRERYSLRRLQLLHLNQIIYLPHISGTSSSRYSHSLICSMETQALSVPNYNMCENNLVLSVHILRKLDVEVRKNFENLAVVLRIMNYHLLRT